MISDIEYKVIRKVIIDSDYIITYGLEYGTESAIILTNKLLKCINQIKKECSN